MKKMPCLFMRNFEGRKATITREVTPSCQWVADGEGVASIKRDGTACAVIGGALHKRYDAKQGKPPPANGIPCDEPDPITGHWPHWVPVVDGDPSSKWHLEAWSKAALSDGTYELCGPKIGGNPEGFVDHVFIRHGEEVVDAPRDFDGLRDFLENLGREGVVFAHPDGRMCKIRRGDFK
jgi:hypothetical protein